VSILATGGPDAIYVDAMPPADVGAYEVYAAV
jgi:hypothetical protein